MDLDKAIEILKEDWKSQETGHQSDYQDAVKLGIEALTAIRDFRKDWSGNRLHLLPGETDPPIPLVTKEPFYGPKF